jgi:hypothetical protein
MPEVQKNMNKIKKDLKSGALLQLGMVVPILLLTAATARARAGRCP